jgi:ferrous iron transport protein B
MRLIDLNTGEHGVVSKVKGRGAFRRRILEMGFIKGKKVSVVKKAPLKDPIEYKIMGYSVSLRRSEATHIEVITEEEAKNNLPLNYEGTITDDKLRETAKKKGKVINVALIGNPNSGKTTLFNYASRSRERVGNYSGVTVDSKMAHFEHKGYIFNIVDLPGTYSLTTYSPEELFVRKYIADNIPDVVVNVVDASNLERNMYLTTQIIDMDVKMIVALNMYDELRKKGDHLDYEFLGKMMGMPFVPTTSSRGIGIMELFDKIINVYTDKDKTLRHIHINYGLQIEQSIENIQASIKHENNYHVTDKYSSRFLAIKLLEKDKNALAIVKTCHNYQDIKAVAQAEINRLEKELNDDSETIITDAKYGFIAGALKETFSEGVVTRRRNTEIIDTFFTHRLFGFPVFIFFIWLMFQATFTLGAYPMEWIEKLVELLGNSLNTLLPQGMFKDLIVNGVIDGVGGVIVFLPNILILFFFISLMEDTGYMARAAFIMDKLMHKIGLHGRSFIPLIMGFGCNVPAIMATRTIENKQNRVLTMLINPFMSCSARLPVYVLFISAFFPDHPGTMLFLIYFIGILMAIGMALVLKKTLFKTEGIPFVMELPPYRMPTLKSTTIHMWNKGEQYLKKMGGIILIASVIIWALSYFPRDHESNARIVQAPLKTTSNAEDTFDPAPVDVQDKKNITGGNNEQSLTTKRVEQSYIARIGKTISPVMKPLGFDWKMTVSLLSGIAAKEIVVSTMGVLYQGNETGTGAAISLEEKLQEQTYQEGPQKGEKIFTPLVAFSYMLFILIYFPCIAVIAAIKKESGSWKWAAFTVVYTTALAWIASFLVYNIGSIFV